MPSFTNEIHTNCHPFLFVDGSSNCQVIAKHFVNIQYEMLKHDSNLHGNGQEPGFYM